MKEEEKVITPEFCKYICDNKFYDKMFENIPMVSMKVFSCENITDADVARAEKYRMRCNGNAYIPPQDMILYERSYQKINEINKNGRKNDILQSH